MPPDRRPSTTTCRAFESRLQGRLDSRAQPLTPLDDPAWSAHLATCPVCAATLARFERLDQAMHAWIESPAPALGFADRVLAAHTEAGSSVPLTFARPRSAVVQRWALAAGLLVAAVGTYFGVSRFSNPPGQVAIQPATPIPAAPRPLSAALADATAATWDLARTTSAPAGRVTREAWTSVAPTSGGRLALGEVGPATPRAFQSVVQRVQMGVRPLQGSARHAFSFLIPTGRRAERPKGKASS